MCGRAYLGNVCTICVSQLGKLQRPDFLTPGRIALGSLNCCSIDVQKDLLKSKPRVLALRSSSSNCCGVIVHHHSASSITGLRLS